MLATSGDISLAEARKLAEAKLGAWKKAGTPDPVFSDPPALGPAKVHFVARPDSVQSSLWIGTQRGFVSSFALQLESPTAVLGNYITSRLCRLPADYWDKLPARIDAVTQEQRQEADASSAFCPLPFALLERN